MKKFLLSVVTMIYLCVSSGFAMEIHYCMGKKAGLDFYKTAGSGKCSKCGMKDKKGGCCNDEHRFYKLADAHKNISSDAQAVIQFVAVADDLNYYPAAIILSARQSCLLSNSSPPGAVNPIYLLHRNFRL